uniref:Soluble scavenger receptor cysteine-rich domain-containing protein SSC5D n=1 Tax=Salmo trutta TaxID=8032 RepID=A0A673ZSQ7_SALTR
MVVYFLCYGFYLSITDGISRVRLVNGPNNCSGRVEVFDSGQWGTVCDDDWDQRDAQVMCREFGCGEALEAFGSARFGKGSGSISLDDLACSGSEDSLLQCPHSGLGNHDCGHHEDAGVTCLSLFTGPTENNSISRVRLVNGPNNCSGRVEVFHSGQWGTVCDDDWDLLDAKVVCRALGCGVALEAPDQAHFGQGRGEIWLKDVQCSGNEGSLLGCSSDGLRSHNCGHSEDAAVICQGQSVRLVDGPNRCSGRVEVYQDGSWGTVCDDNWALLDAQVVCRELSCGPATEAPHQAHFGEGSGSILLDDVACMGSEGSLLECSSGGIGNHDCGHDEDASVTCMMDGIFTVRLVNGPNNCSGRVEVFDSGQWGTVCDDDWDQRDAQVMCRELGCGEALEAFGSARFGKGSGSISLDDLACSGSEDSLLQCPHSGLGNHDCGHHEDAGVTCCGKPLSVTIEF